jgi:hypothetical protein
MSFTHLLPWLGLSSTTEYRFRIFLGNPLSHFLMAPIRRRMAQRRFRSFMRSLKHLSPIMMGRQTGKSMSTISAIMSKN